VHAVLGNHDWWDDLNAQRTGKGPVLGRRMLERVGIPVYENDVTRISKDEHAFWLAGLGDQIALITSLAQEDVFANSSASTICPVRSPRSPDDAPVHPVGARSPTSSPRSRAALPSPCPATPMAAKFRVFGYSPMVPSRYGNRYAYGHVVEDESPPESSRAGLGLLRAARAHRHAARDREWWMSQPDASPHWPDLAGRIVADADGRRHVLPIRVYFEDTDFSGPRLSRLLRALVRAAGRSDFLRLIGNDHRAS